MPYLSIADFKFGVDRRRDRLSGVPGTLWTLDNAVISRGGDVERMKRFVPVYTLPAGTFGLHSPDGQLTVFGAEASIAGIPPGVRYVQLEAPGAPDMVRVLDASL